MAALTFYLLQPIASALAQIQVTATSSPRLSVQAGEPFELSVTAQGANAFQWKVDGRLIQGATTSRLSRMNTAPIGDGGVYSVEISATTPTSKSSIYRLFRVAVTPKSGTVAYTSWPSGNAFSGRTDITAISTYFNDPENLRSLAMTTGGQALSLSQSQLPAASSIFAIAAGKYYIMNDGSLRHLRRAASYLPYVLNAFAGISDVIDVRSAAPSSNSSLALTSKGMVYELIDNEATDSNGAYPIPSQEGDAILLSGQGVVRWNGNYYGWTTGPRLDLQTPIQTATIGAEYIGSAWARGIAYLRSDGTVVWWDNDLYRKAPSTFSQIKKIVYFADGILGVKEDNTLVYWVLSSTSPTVSNGVSSYDPRAEGRRFFAVESGHALYEINPSDAKLAITETMGAIAVNLDDPLVLTVRTNVPAFPPLWATWSKDGVPITYNKVPTLNLSPVKLSTTGKYSVLVSNGLASASDSAQVTVSPASPPSILRSPASISINSGESTVLQVVASGSPTPTFQWFKDGVPIQGATRASLTISSVAAANAGSYYVSVRGSYNGAITTLTTLPISVSVIYPAPRLSNLSVRTALEANQLLIVGLTMSGGPKNVLLRAVGPTLGVFGVSEVMADPKIDLYSGSTKVTSNDNWQGQANLASAFQAVGAFALSSTSSLDAALLTLIDGGRTVQVSGPTAGAVLVEGYDAGSGDSPRFSNLSARNKVGTGANILIAGFTLSGNGTRNVLIRAVGPKLADFGVSGVLQDPKVQIYRGQTVVAENDNWAGSLASTFSSVGAFGLTSGSKDAALVIPLQAGSYTVQVSGADGGTGEAIVEIYELP